MQNEQDSASRRGFLKASAVMSAAAVTALGTNFAHAAGTDTIKVGVIGAGGRGSGAVGNHMAAAKIAGTNCEITAVADMTVDGTKNVKGKYKIPDEKTFVGLDAYKQLLSTDVNLVILATPPGFRPWHFEAAIAAGKHVFMEKPVGTDPVNLRKVFAAADVATEKKLQVMTGTQRRHQKPYVDCIKAIHEGAIGDVLHMSIYWAGGGIWWKPRKEGMTDLQYQIYNWYHYIWACGDQICEQHIHNIDVANWVMGGPPISAYGSGGRQSRKEPGQIWDHTVVEYEYANGARVFSMGRHWPKSDENVSEYCIGSKGVANPGSWLEVKGEKRQNFGGGIDPYVQEHVDLLNSIKDGKYVNEAKQVADSTLTAIMGRMACYTGKKVTWDFVRNKSQLDIFPKNLDINAPQPEMEIPEPGKTMLI